MYHLSRFAILLISFCFTSNQNAAAPDPGILGHQILKVLDLRFTGEVTDWHVTNISGYYTWLSSDKYFLILDNLSSKSALVRISDQGESELIGYSRCVPIAIQVRIGEVYPWAMWEKNAQACFKAVIGSLVDPRRTLDNEFFSQPEEYLLDWISDDPGKSGLVELKSYMADYSKKIGRCNEWYFEVHVVTPVGSVVRIRVIAREVEEGSLRIEKETVEFKGNYDSQVVY